MPRDRPARPLESGPKLALAKLILGGADKPDIDIHCTLTDGSGETVTFKLRDYSGWLELTHSNGQQTFSLVSSPRSFGRLHCYERSSRDHALHATCWFSLNVSSSHGTKRARPCLMTCAVVASIPSNCSSRSTSARSWAIVWIFSRRSTSQALGDKKRPRIDPAQV